MQFLKLWTFTFNAYLERRNILSNNLQRCQIINCNKLRQYFSSENRDYLALIIQRLQNTSLSTPQKLKLLMVLHIALIDTNHHYQKISEIQIKVKHCPPKSQDVQISIDSKLQQLVGLYFTFLQKICSICETYKYVKNRSDKMDINSSVSSSKCIEDAFVLINFIKSTWTINRIVMFMGRYAKQTFPLIIDFTILISYDLSRVYNYLLKLRKWMIENFNLFQKQQQKLAVLIIDQIYLVRQLVQYFIYNKYYHKFIRIQPYQEVSVDRYSYAMMLKQAHSIQKQSQIDINNFEDTYFTMVTQNQEKRSKIQVNTKSNIY